MGDGLLGVEVAADQLVDDERRVGGVDAVTTDPVGEYRERIARAFPPEADGTTLFPFRRLFIVATAR